MLEEMTLSIMRQLWQPCSIGSPFTTPTPLIKRLEAEWDGRVSGLGNGRPILEEIMSFTEIPSNQIKRKALETALGGDYEQK